MIILHYSLGFPPFRTGGLTKFCNDLMTQQQNENHQVSLLWPGRIRLLKKKTKIIHSEYNGFASYEIVNPLPVSFDEGIVDIPEYIKKNNKNIYTEFLKTMKPDLIHIHTLMGLHSEFIDAAKEMGVKTVFSTHDFFPICAKVTLMYSGKTCQSFEDCSNCPKCNLSALSLKKIYILQSPLYRIMKDSNIIRNLRKKHRTYHLCGNFVSTNKNIKTNSSDFLKLRRYYSDMLKKIDLIHANSTISKKIYSQVFDLKNIVIVDITHLDIQNKKRIKKFSDKVIKFTYLGAPSEAKGYYFLKNVLDTKWKKNKDFILNIYFKDNDYRAYIISHNKYNYDQLETIFENTDALIVPSIWNETFGYTVIEALSYGVPVIISDTVGAKDIVPDGCGFVFKSNNYMNLTNFIDSVNKEVLQKMNNQIVKLYRPKKMLELSEQIYLELFNKKGV